MRPPVPWYSRLLDARIRLSQGELSANVGPLDNVALWLQNLQGVLGIKGRVQLKLQELIVEHSGVKRRKRRISYVLGCDLRQKVPFGGVLENVALIRP